MAFESTSNTPSDIRQVIQLAIAPVFLLTAVGTTLNVLTNRLARIVDRGRLLEDRLSQKLPAQAQELPLLERRARMIYVAMTLSTISALLVSILIAVAFFGYVLQIVVPWLMASLFILAMLAYTTSLFSLLGEVFLAVRSFRLGIASSTEPDLVRPGGTPLSGPGQGGG